MTMQDDNMTNNLYSDEDADAPQWDDREAMNELRAAVEMGKTPATKKQTSQAAFVRASTVKAKPKPWLIDNFVMTSGTHILTGRGSVGKSTMCSAIAATASLNIPSDRVFTHEKYSRFRGMDPAAVAATPVDPSEREIWAIHAEEEYDAARRRYAANGVHPENVVFLEVATPTAGGEMVTQKLRLPRDERVLDRALRENEVAGRKPPILVFDGMLDAFENEPGAKSTNTNDALDVRRFMGVINRFADVYRTLNLLVTHPAKNASDPDNFVANSAAFQQAVRTVIGFETYPGDESRRVMGVTKSNYGVPKWYSTTYSIHSEIVGESIDLNDPHVVEDLQRDPVKWSQMEKQGWYTEDAAVVRCSLEESRVTIEDAIDQHTMKRLDPSGNDGLDSAIRAMLDLCRSKDQVDGKDVHEILDVYGVSAQATKTRYMRRLGFQNGRGSNKSSVYWLPEDDGDLHAEFRRRLARLRAAISVREGQVAVGTPDSGRLCPGGAGMRGATFVLGRVREISLQDKDNIELHPLPSSVEEANQWYMEETGGQSMSWDDGEDGDDDRDPTQPPASVAAYEPDLPSDDDLEALQAQTKSMEDEQKAKPKPKKPRKQAKKPTQKKDKAAGNLDGLTPPPPPMTTTQKKANDTEEKSDDDA